MPQGLVLNCISALVAFFLVSHIQGSRQLRLAGRFCTTLCAGVIGLPRPVAALTPAFLSSIGFSPARNREKNVSSSGFSRNERLLHLALRTRTFVRGALTGLNGQGLMHTQHPRSRARVTRSERLISRPGTVRFHRGRPGGTQPLKGLPIPWPQRFVPPSWRFIPTHMRAWCRQVGDQGALIQPE